MTQKIIQNNFDVGRNGNSPKYVVIHTNGNPTPTTGDSLSLYSWFNNPSSQVSAHYQVMLNGDVEQYVDESNTAWHSGVEQVNFESIGIEHQDNGYPNDSVRTDALYNSSIQLIADIYKRYNWDITDQGLIKPHNEIAPSHACPGGLDINRIRSGVISLLSTPVKIWKLETKNGVVEYATQDEIFNAWVVDPTQIVRKYGEDVTDLFFSIKSWKDASDSKDTQISSLNAQISDLKKQVASLQLENSSLILDKAELQKEIDSYKPFIFNFYYKI